jgi:hypothetical protein
MELKKFDKKSVREHWNKKVRKELLGKTITKVEYLTYKETEDNLWYKTPIAIQLDNKIWLVPMADDEGNDGGSISTNIKGLSVIPTI